MRINLCILVIIAGLMQVSAATFAQKITLSEKNASLSQVLSQIRRQSGYDVICRDELLNKSAPVTVTLNNATLDDALKASLQGQALSYEIEDGTIIIKEKEPTLLDKIKAVLAIPITVSGKVQDDTGQPMVGVTITIKGTNNATTTDDKGAFSFSVPNDKTILIFSYIGFETQEFAASDISKDFRITLKRNLTNLNEVTIVNKGYYTTRKELETGDVSSVSAKEIEQQPVSNALAALEGRIPGMVITQTTGVPGGGFTVQIRGQNSIANGNDPFYIIDGVPYASQTLGSINPALKGGNPLNFINPFDIESIDVLKDADATAIYGSRGANGVILITTKKGKINQTKVDFNVYRGVGQVSHMMNLLNTQQYLTMRHEAFKNDGATPDPTYDYDLTLWDTTRNTNWQKLLIGGTAHYTDAQGSVSGGNENTQYLIGGGYHQETTVFPGDGGDQKASVHFNINNTSPNKKFKITLSGTYVADLNTSPQADLTYRSLNLPPDAPALYNADGSLNWMPISPGQGGTWTNPLSYNLLTAKGRTSNLVSNAVVSYTVFHGLELKSSLGYTNTQTNETITQPTTAFDPGSNTTSGYSQFNSTNLRSWIIEPQANYKVTIGKGILTTLIGATFQQNTSDGQSFSATGFASDALLTNIKAATSLTVGNTISNQYKYNAIFGHVNYDWEDKYLLNLTIRRDGSSRFGPANQFANFSSIGAAWIFSNETFVQQLLPFLTSGKLRGSYGSTGNDQIQDYRFLDLFTPTQYSYQNTKGLYPTNIFNPYLSWELTKKLEFGIELGALKDRIDISASYFRNRTDNQLVVYPLSAVTGFASIASNLPALVQNSGWELLLNTFNVKSSNFSWRSSINLTFPESKLVAYPNFSNSPYNYNLVIGQPITITKVYHVIGVNDQTGAYQFAGSKGPTDTPDFLSDRTAIINTAPKFYGGFQNSFTFKEVSLDFLFQFVKQTGKNFWYGTSSNPGEMINQPVEVLSRWQKTGDVKPIQQFTQDYASQASDARYTAVSSDFNYGDASYIRLKNLSLSWQLPLSWTQKMSLQSCRIYLQGQNLLTITNYFGLDPETQSNVLPPLRVWTVGCQITLK